MICIQAIERAANGRKKQVTMGKKDNQNGFFRLIRPDSGFTGKDEAWRGALDSFCSLKDVSLPAHEPYPWPCFNC